MLGAPAALPGSADAWNREGVQAELRAGRAALVVFTADWCLTCKVNEHAVLADAEVRDAMRRLGVVTFVGDWTQRDERIRAELARFGRAGVPMYLVYTPSEPGEPALLPELLTVERVLEALRAAARVSETAADTAPRASAPAGA